MARTKEFDNLTVVRAARDAFWEHGWASTGLVQLQQATGLSRSSLYETFGSKRGLFESAAQNYLYEIIGPLLAPMETGAPGRDELMDYFATFAVYFRSSPRQVANRGCLMLNTAMELNALDEPAAEMVRAYRQRVRAAIYRALTAIPSVTDLDTTADLLTAGQIGMMITSRLDPEQAAQLAGTLAVHVASL